MLASLRRKMTYANVASTLALVLAASGGVAYAANTIYSTDIVDGQVKRVDIGNGAVNSGKVGDNSLTGLDILESTLSGVNADTVDGYTAGNLIRVGGVTKRAGSTCLTAALVWITWSIRSMPPFRASCF